MNKNVKRIFFVTTLLIMLVAVSTVSATDNTTKSNPVSDTTISDTSNIATNEVIETSDNTEVKTKNNNNNKNNIKKEAQTITLNSNNFDEYVTDGKFNDNVTDGDTIDIRGKLDSPKFALNVNKAVNIISSTNDAYIDLNTLSADAQGGYKNGIFQVTKNATGTNITGITFHNTRITISDTENVVIDNISCIVEQSIGMGFGSFSIRGGSNNITVKNSYFMNYPNGGHSNVVIAGASNCLIENNSIQCDNNKGITGNLLYLTTYYSNGISNHNITIRNNTIRTIGKYYETNYGLVLEGSGHIIEGNIIDNERPVMAQYADAAYGMETNIDEIIFNNNTIIKGTPQLVFPGIVANNTFNGEALLKQVYAYNNTFNRVTIQNNVKFENNTAKYINITGNNNILNNNEIYSNEDYAVTITGNNNTLSENKIAGYLGRGENAISNTTEIISINNSEDISRVFYIDDNNWEKYFTLRNSNIYDFNTGTFRDGDTLIFNTVNKTNLRLMDRNKGFTQDDTLVLINNVNSINCNIKIIAINNTIPEFSQCVLGAVRSQVLSLINSTVYKTGKEPIENINSIVLYYGTTCQYPKDNTYVLDYYYQDIANIPDQAKIYVINYNRLNLNFTKQLNIEGLFDGILSSNLTLLEGSTGSTISGITFNEKVIINDTNIIFTNCTFNGEVEVNKEYPTFKGNIFNNNITLNNVNSLIFSNNTVNSALPINITSTRLANIENNTIYTTADNTIVFDEESNSNTVKNNILIANTLLGDDSVVGGDNVIEDNGASYNTSIEISGDDSLFKNDESNITITVYNLLNNTPVDKGYVEVYLDGVLQGIKTLVDGQISLQVNTEKSSLGTVPLKVWYYEGIRYANNVTSVNVDVVKSNVTITFDEFTAKLNEKATVTATFLNQNSNPVQDTNVTFTVGRSSYTVETVDGIATLNEIVTKEWLDAGRISISFPNTDSYNSNTTRINMNLTKDDVTPTMTVNQDNDVVNIYMELVDSLNNSVTDGKITVTTMDGTQLNSTRIRNGTYNTTITLPEDYTENLIVNYTNSYYYNDITQEIEITNNITETITKIDIPEIALINTPIEIKATVTDTEGNIINNGLVLFTIDDEVIAQANITEGIATTTVTFNEEKELTIKATYQKTKEFASSNAETTINIQKPTTQLNIEDINITAGETVTLTATVTDQFGNNITGGKVVFNVNGKTVKDANGKAVYAKVVDGIASVNYTTADNLAGKDIEITAVYTGYKTYESAKANTTATVNPKELTLTTTATTTQLTATLSDNTINTGKIVFKINGKTVKDANGKVIYAKVVNGTVSVDYALPETYKAGNYTVIATFVASGYDKLVANTTLTVAN